MENQDESGTDGMGHQSDIDEEVQSLDVCNQDAPADMAFLDGLHDARWNVRERAVGALREQAEHEEYTLQALIGAVSDEHQSVREAAVRMLRGPSKISRVALEAVITAVNDTQWNVQEAAVQVLGDQPQLSREAFIVLIGAARSRHLHVMDAVVETLIKHADSESVLQGLIEIIQSKSRTDRMLAMMVLGMQVKLPEAAVDALIGTLGGDDQDIIASATFALQRQELSGSARQALLRKLQDESSNVREAAILVLGNRTDVSGSIIPL